MHQTSVIDYLAYAAAAPCRQWIHKASMSISTPKKVLTLEAQLHLGGQHKSQSSKGGAVSHA
jgi:hypothetical protein